jgi:hypothetical protein
MRRITATLLVLTVCNLGPTGCNTPTETGEATATAADWTATISMLESTGDGGVSVQTPDADSFAPWRGGQPIPPGSAVKTGKTTRAEISISEGADVTLNHSTEIELTENRGITVRSGQVVLNPTGSAAEDFTLTAPGG